MNNNEYYWLQTEFNYGDFSIHKFALHKVTIDENGEEDDEVILWSAYEDIPDIPEDEDDLGGSWSAIDSYIESELGFLPEYQVN